MSARTRQLHGFRFDNRHFISSCSFCMPPTTSNGIDRSRNTVCCSIVPWSDPVSIRENSARVPVGTAVLPCSSLHDAALCLVPFLSSSDSIFTNTPLSETSIRVFETINKVSSLGQFKLGSSGRWYGSSLSVSPLSGGRGGRSSSLKLFSGPQGTPRA